MHLGRLAPAKVNLFLHVGAPGADGYHPISSLMVFADIGDRISLEREPGPDLAVIGPFAADLAGETDNLVLRARDRLLSGRPPSWPPFRLVLDKRLPIASGLGGGSADAAAALILLRDALALDVGDEALQDLAAGLGSDVPACLASRSVMAAGRGDRLSPAPPLPALNAVLVNPRLPSPTGAIYRAYDRAVAPQGADLPPWPREFAGAKDVAAFLADCRNDLQVPAVVHQPVIAEVLARLAGAPETLLARMSGSGATCFALCSSAAAAARLAAKVGATKPNWWVQACVLGA